MVHNIICNSEMLITISVILVFIRFHYVYTEATNQTVDSNETNTSPALPMSTMSKDTDDENGSKQLLAGSYLYDNQLSNDTKETKKRRVCLSGMYLNYI